MSTELDLSRRAETVSAPQSVNLAGLSLPRIRERLEEIGVEKRKVKMRANQI